MILHTKLKLQTTFPSYRSNSAGKEQRDLEIGLIDVQSPEVETGRAQPVGSNISMRRSRKRNKNREENLNSPQV